MQSKNKKIENDNIDTVKKYGGEYSEHATNDNEHGGKCKEHGSKDEEYSGSKVSEYITKTDNKFRRELNLLESNDAFDKFLVELTMMNWRSSQQHLHLTTIGFFKINSNSFL